MIRPPRTELVRAFAIGPIVFRERHRRPYRDDNQHHRSGGPNRDFEPVTYHRRFLRFGLGFPPRAWDSAMATACFCGLPCAISVLMLAEMVLGDFPRFSGIYAAS